MNTHLNRLSAFFAQAAIVILLIAALSGCGTSEAVSSQEPAKVFLDCWINPEASELTPIFSDAIGRAHCSMVTSKEEADIWVNLADSDKGRRVVILERIQGKWFPRAEDSLPSLNEPGKVQEAAHNVEVVLSGEKVPPRVAIN